MLKKYSFLVCLPLLFLSACQTVTSYGDPQQVETVNEDFGSTDLQMIAEKMTRSLLQRSVISKASIENPAIVTLSGFKNRTKEFIDTKMINEKVRVLLLQSGQVRIGVGVDEMQAQVDELVRQNDSQFYRKQGRSKIGNMVPAKYRIEGSLSSIVKTSRVKNNLRLLNIPLPPLVTKQTKDNFYLFNMSLIEIESGLVIWSDEKEIRKTTK